MENLITLPFLISPTSLLTTGWKKMEIKFGKSCSGAVFVYSQGGQRNPVSMQGWTETAGRRLCQDLKCGSLKSNTTTSSDTPFWSSSFSCEGVVDPKNIWECEEPGLTSQEQQQGQALYIECQGKIYFLRIAVK